MSFKSSYRRLDAHVTNYHGIEIIFERSYAELNEAHRRDHELGFADHAALIPFTHPGGHRPRPVPIREEKPGKNRKSKRPVLTKR